MTGRRLHILVVLVLVVCLVSPFVEIAFHSTGSIFRTGQDRESTVAILLVLVELAFAFAGLLVVLLTGLVEKEGVLTLHGRAGFTMTPATPLSTSSPPICLRI